MHSLRTESEILEFLLLHGFSQMDYFYIDWLIDWLIDSLIDW